MLYCIALALLALSALVTASPFPAPHVSSEPTPTVEKRVETLSLFTVQAFQSPYPSGSGLTGYYLNSKNGALYLSATKNTPPAVFYVNSQANAYLNTYPPTQVYLDTYHGQLGASKTQPATAMIVPFYHLGTGTTVYTPQNGYVTEGSALFQWIGSQNSYWFACPQGSGKYGVFKQMTVTNPDLGNCTAVELAAVDYK